MKNILILFLVVILSGCAIGQTVNYTGDLDVQVPRSSGNNEIVIAVQDLRPRTLSGDDSPSRVGSLRSIAGIPYALKTQSGAPLADDFASSLNKEFESVGYKSSFLISKPTDSEEELQSKAKAINPNTNNTFLHFKILSWFNDNWFSSDLEYCLELKSIANDCSGLAKYCGEKKLSNSNVGFENLYKAVGTIFTSLIKDPSTSKCLATAATKENTTVKKANNEASSRLNELKQLFDKKLITEKDFNKKKNEILLDM